MKKLWLAIILLVGLMPKAVLAHCPLCTAAAGGLAILAASLGVSSVIVGILIGAFALALSLWLAGLVKKTYFRFQKSVLTIVIFLVTVLPIMPLVQDFSPLYVALFGEYGTWLHTTYTINLYLFGVAIGAVIVASAPYLSRLVTRLRGKQLPYQGLIITLTLLVVASVIVQLFS
ncbi:MAG: hypothetical protein WD552_00285 [Candidatus Paceibacterota bacterium]